MRIATFVIVLFAVFVFVPPASACEQCVSAGYNGWVKCESGHASGYEWCYGGFGVPCEKGGSCGGGGECPPCEPVHKDSDPFASTPCFNCVGEEPFQGFQLQVAANESGDGAESRNVMRDVAPLPRS